jgi:formate hydrogenlyase subunit 6/NADH:ubiquinone oxidoreductase subunit I
MDINSFVQGTLLKIALVIFVAVVIARMSVFVVSIIKSAIGNKSGLPYLLGVFARFLAPFHRAVAKNPLFSFLRYIFHACLFVVPIWYSGHISLWAESRLGWSWKSLPDKWADWMTLILLALTIFFVIRHFATKELRSRASGRDFVIIIMAALPFLTGYALTHGTVDSIPFFADNMWTIHILSGELMMIGAAFLLLRSRLDQNKCTGCASCVLACPTGTLESRDSGKLRIFSYSHYQCIACGSCVKTCPEGAAELRHEIGLKKLFNIFAKDDIRSVELESCTHCGKLFVPELLMEKIHRKFSDEYLTLCPDCRKVEIGDHILRFSPRHHKPTQTIKMSNT